MLTVTDTNGVPSVAKWVHIAKDTTAPTSKLEVGTPKHGSYVSSATPLTVTATDDAAGVGAVEYRAFPQGSAPPAFTRVSADTATFSVTGSDGPYDVHTRAIDDVGTKSGSTRRP